MLTRRIPFLSPFHLVIWLIPFFVLSLARAQTWDGGGVNDNWTAGNNWNPNSAPANNGTANINFAGTVRLTPKLNQNRNINSLTFSNNAGAFTLSGSRTLTIGAGGMTNNSANTQTIAATGISLSAAQTWAANSGNLAISSAVNLNGNRLTTRTGSGRTITLSGVVSGTGGLTAEGTGTLVLSGASANTFSGTTIINGGTLSVTSAGALAGTAGLTINPAGALSLGGPANLNRVNNAAGITLNGGTINLNSSIEAMGGLTLSAGSSSTINLQSGNGSGQLTFSSAGAGSGASLVISSWTGTPTGGTDDRIFVTASPSVIFLDSILFAGYQPGAVRLASGEIIPANTTPVPEVTALYPAIALFGFAILRWRKK